MVATALALMACTAATPAGSAGSSASSPSGDSYDAVALGMEEALDQYLEKGITVTYDYMAPDVARRGDHTVRCHFAAGQNAEQAEARGGAGHQQVLPGHGKHGLHDGCGKQARHTEYEEGLNKKIQAGEMQKLAVVAAGYSTLRESDQQLHFVFARADQMMYERKQELKAMGAHTRD